MYVYILITHEEGESIVKKFIVCFLCIAFIMPAFTQSAATVTEILDKPTANYRDFSYLIVAEAGMESSPDEAYSRCEQFDTFPSSDTPDSPITAKTVSYFLMKNYKVPGGLMWTAVQSPRYAWKEMKASGFWLRGFDPDRELSGREVVQAVSKFFEENPKAVLRKMPAAPADSAKETE